MPLGLLILIKCFCFRKNRHGLNLVVDCNLLSYTNIFYFEANGWKGLDVHDCNVEFLHVLLSLYNVYMIQKEIFLVNILIQLEFLCSK